MKFDKNFGNDNYIFDLMAKEYFLLELKELDEKLTKMAKHESNLTLKIKKDL